MGRDRVLMCPEPEPDPEPDPEPCNAVLTGATSGCELRGLAEPLVHRREQNLATKPDFQPGSTIADHRVIHRGPPDLILRSGTGRAGVRLF